jgi:hypothetical protein
VSENSDSQEGRERGSGGSYDPANRQGLGRGLIQHNKVNIEDKGEFVDGRLKVDSWNLNYTGKKKKLRKKKVTQGQKNKMSAL